MSEIESKAVKIREVLTAGQMREAETSAIASGRVTGLELMERAGEGCVVSLFEKWPDLSAPKADARRTPTVVVLCGPGNNGGDGYVIARLLAQKGCVVTVYSWGEAVPPDAQTNCQRWLSLGPVHPLCDERIGELLERLDPNDNQLVLVDALFGTGLTRPVAGIDRIAAGLYQARQRGGVRCLAVDMPSGLCADSGRLLCDRDETAARQRLEADLTVTFHRPKLGHVLADGPDACGALAVVDIGLEQ